MCELCINLSMMRVMDDVLLFVLVNDGAPMCFSLAIASYYVFSVRFFLEPKL